MRTGIRVRDGGSYVPKEVIFKQFNNGYRPSILCIEDPLNPSNDIGKGSYGVLTVKKAFEHAYQTLSEAVAPQHSYLIKDNHRLAYYYFWPNSFLVDLFLLFFHLCFVCLFFSFSVFLEESFVSLKRLSNTGAG